MATNNSANIGVVTSGSNTHVFPAAPDTLVGRNSSDVLTNKDLTSSTNIFTPYKQIVAYSLSSTTFSASTTFYFSIFGGNATTSSTTENQRAVTLPAACRFSKLYIRTFGTQSSTGSFVFTLRKNFGNTILQVTIAANAVAGVYSDTTNEVDFAVSDEVCIAFANNATVNSAPVRSISLILTHI